ncbi:MAG: GNAT family N-acetyltransferase [Clostridiales bacterium]|nr:GNAT family N-acetyltransferase [Clostridiales bacterium]
MISIRPLDKDTAFLFNRIDNRYLVEERVNILFNGSLFTLDYTPLDEPQWHICPPDTQYTAQELIQRDDAACFFAFLDEQPAGQAVVTAKWNHLATLWDIRVDMPYRGKGAGRALINACVDWARKHGLKGLVAETQDTNPAACRFYQHTGFVLGGADGLLYTAIPIQEGSRPVQQDSALFFYLLPDRI